VMIHKLTLASIETIPVEVIELMLSELGISDLKLVDVNVLELMLSKLETHEIRDIFIAKFDEMSASEELFWLLASKRISQALSPEFAQMKVNPQAKLTEFIAVDYDKAVQRGSQVAVLDGAEMDLLAFQRQVTGDTRLIILNFVDQGLTNYHFRRLKEEDYDRIIKRMRSRRNIMNKLYPDIPTAVHVTLGRGNSDLYILRNLGFKPDYIGLTGFSSPYAQFDAIANRYAEFDAQLIPLCQNEIRGFEWGGEAWAQMDKTLREHPAYAGYLWRSADTPGGRKRIETRKP
jgi:hypothetical protein